MHEKEFEELGLTRGESKVYFYLLKAGASTTGPIVKSSKVSYSKVYEILERLVRKGLVSYIIRKKTKYYKALPPSRLKDYINKEKKELKDKEKRLDEILLKLKNMAKDSETSAEIYTGVKSLTTAYENLLDGAKKGDRLKYFFSYKHGTYKRMNDFYYQLFPKLKKLGISLNGIANEEFRNQFRKEEPPKFLKAKFVKFPTPSNIDVFDDKILITVWEGTPMAVLIISREVSDSFREYFDDVWKTAKP